MQLVVSPKNNKRASETPKRRQANTDSANPNDWRFVTKDTLIDNFRIALLGRCLPENFC